MATDESFKRPGSVPFKWELRPGVPLSGDVAPNHTSDPVSFPPSYTPSSTPLLASINANHAARCPSDRWRFQRSVLDLARSGRHANLGEEVGCFARGERKRGRGLPREVVKEGSGDGNDEEMASMVAELQTLARWSMSARKSLSPESPPVVFSPAFPAREKDADWAGYGLF